VRIQVTIDDIENGKPLDCSRCPLALALNRATNRTDWFVDYGTAYFGSGFSHESAALPRECLVFVRRFDNYRDGNPFSFEVELPAGWDE